MPIRTPTKAFAPLATVKLVADVLLIGAVRVSSGAPFCGTTAVLNPVPLIEFQPGVNRLRSNAPRDGVSSRKARPAKSNDGILVRLAECSAEEELRSRRSNCCSVFQREIAAEANPGDPSRHPEMVVWEAI
jgi:hypothetical protein